MRTRSRNLDVIHHGMVMVSDGRGKGRPARLELTKDILAVQIPMGMSDSLERANVEIDSGLRTVLVKKEKDGGLGLSIKGGSDPTGDVPIVISKIFKDHSADQTGQLFVGDAIVEVNGIPLEGKSHDETVQLLKSAKDEITLLVRHYTQLATYLKPSGSLQRDMSGGAVERYSDTSGTWKSSLKAQSETVQPADRLSVGSGSTVDEAPDGWKTLIRIPLPMAFVTRYLWGTDKLRSNALEVRAVDGSSTGVMHCDDGKALEQWLKHIQNNITNLNRKSIKMSNKYLHSSEQIVHLGWISERRGEDELSRPWQPRFLILKGADLCLFHTPPLNADDMAKCVCMYKVYETVLRTVREGQRLDRRERCFWIESAGSTGVSRHYVAVETGQQLALLQQSWYRVTHTAIHAIQSKTFACNFQGRPSGLVVDLRSGFSLYDIPTKKYIWQYAFAKLTSSADDGKMHVQLVFRNESKPEEKDVKDLDCVELYPLVFTIHSFYVAKIIGQDPDYLKTALF